MKLIIQIPCYNEENTLPLTYRDLPKQIEGIDEIETLIINDGSTDNTVEVARKIGVDHIVSFNRNKGLARAFNAGIEKCLELGADIIVNTDADNQYCGQDIPALVRPILEGTADFVVGARPIAAIDHFSPLKKLLQKLGSWVVRVVSQTDIPDAPSGFRAISRDAAMQLNIFNKYTYTLETIIQAGQKNMAITSVPIRVNEDLRPSRLVKSIPSYIKRSIFTIIRIFVVYKPFRFFMSIAVILLGLGILLGGRFLFYFMTGEGQGHIQSVILSGVLLAMGCQTVLVAFLADIIAANRQLLERVNYLLNKQNKGE